MKFSGLQENIKEGLLLVNHIAGKNINLPILNNVMIKASEGNIKFITTNLEIGIISYVRGKVETEGEYTVDSKVISDYVSLLPNKKISIELKESEIKVECENFKTKIKGQSTEEYPLIPKIEKESCYKVVVGEFKKALNKVIFSVSNNETRLELSGVFFNFENEKLILAATDSYRLSERSVKVKPVNKENTSKNVIIPAKTLQEVVRILSSLREDNEEDELEIYISESQVLFKTSSVEIISRLIEGQYPDYKQIIPTNTKTTIIINKNELMRAVKASALFSKIGINDVSLDFPEGKNQTVITSESGQTGESVVNINSLVTGGDNGVVVNYRYLLDGLNSFEGENIKIEVIDNNTPCILKSEKNGDDIYIIMPIKQ